MHPTLDFSHHFRFFNMQYLFFLKEIMYSYLSIFPIGFAGEMTRFLFTHFPAETVGTGDPPKSGSGRCGFGALCGLTVFAAQRRSREGQMCLVNVSCHLERNLLELSCCIGLTKISLIRTIQEFSRREWSLVGGNLPRRTLRQLNMGIVTIWRPRNFVWHETNGFGTRPLSTDVNSKRQCQAPLWVVPCIYVHAACHRF